MTDSVLLVEKEPPLGWLIFNRPEKLNAFNAAMWGAISGALSQLEADPEVRVIVVRGAGDRAFSAGADISEFDSAPKTGDDDGESIFGAFDALAACTKPTVAMIHGVCMGGGCAAALSIDIRLASETAEFANVVLPASSSPTAIAPTSCSSPAASSRPWPVASPSLQSTPSLRHGAGPSPSAEAAAGAASPES